MKRPDKIRILIADDHYIVRMGLIALVNTEPDMEVIAEAADGSLALELFTKHQPDLMLLDLRMPGKSGIQTMIEIRTTFPAARILVLSAFDGDEDIHQALRAGAHTLPRRISHWRDVAISASAICSPECATTDVAVRPNLWNSSPPYLARPGHCAGSC